MLQTFTAEQRAQQELVSPSGDGDGIGNAVEFFSGTDASNTASFPTPEIVVLEGSGGLPHLAFQWIRSVTDSGAAATLEHSRDLVTWEPVTEATELHAEPDASLTTETITLLPPADLATGDALYLRMRVDLGGG